MPYVSVPDFVLGQIVKIDELNLLRENVRFMTEVFFDVLPTFQGYGRRLLMDKDVTNGGKIEFGDASKFLILNKTTPRQIDFTGVGVEVCAPKIFYGGRSWISFGSNSSIAGTPAFTFGPPNVNDGAWSPSEAVSVVSLSWCVRVIAFTAAGNFSFKMQKNAVDQITGASTAVAAINTSFSGRVTNPSPFQLLTTDRLNGVYQRTSGTFSIIMGGLFEVIHARG